MQFIIMSQKNKNSMENTDPVLNFYHFFGFLLLWKKKKKMFSYYI